MAAHILYVFSPSSNISPFDVNMALDAGYSHVVPFCDVQLSDVAPLIQDAVFCRPPGRHNETGIFIGGRDVNLASDMFLQAKKSMLGDFEVALFADPNGAYTTSAAIIALVEKALKIKTNQGLYKRKVTILGTGPVGLCCAVLASKQGAEARICQLIADDDRQPTMKFFSRYEVTPTYELATTLNEKLTAVNDAEVIISVAKAGIRILDVDVMDHASRLLVCADSNAVPPSGIVGVDAHDWNQIRSSKNRDFLAIGALAIGGIKYKTEISLFRQMQSQDKAAVLDFPEAFALASNLVEQEQDKAA